MKNQGWVLFILLNLVNGLWAWASVPADALRLYAGYTTRIHCEGRLLLSSVGSESLVRLSALPKESGCGVLVRPMASSGRTNLILETTSGFVDRILEVTAQDQKPSLGELRFFLKGEAQ